MSTEQVDASLSAQDVARAGVSNETYPPAKAASAVRWAPALMPELVIEAGRSDYWLDLWRYRELFQVLAWRDISVRYKQTVRRGMGADPAAPDNGGVNDRFWQDWQISFRGRPLSADGIGRHFAMDVVLRVVGRCFE